MFAFCRHLPLRLSVCIQRDTLDWTRPLYLSLFLSFDSPNHPPIHHLPTHPTPTNKQKQAVIDYKFRTFGRAVLTTEAAVHFLLLMVFSSYLLAVCAALDRVDAYLCVAVVMDQ